MDESCPAICESNQRLKLGLTMAEFDQEIIFSKFLCDKFTENDGVIFHSLHPNQSVGVGLYDWMKFNTFPVGHRQTSLFQQLSQQDLIINSPEVDDQALEKAKTNCDDLLPSHPTTLYLMLTRDCNLRCSYCPFAQSSSSGGLMEFSTAKQGIDYWARSIRNPDQPHNIIFYGGEPLLNKQVLRQSLGYIHHLKLTHQLPFNLRLLVDTNGLLIDQTVIGWFKQFGTEVTLALDDFSAANDNYRIDSQGHGTLQAVLRTLKMLQEAKIPTYLSTSLTQANINRLDQLVPAMKNYSLQGIGMNILRGQLSDQSAVQEISAEAMVDFHWSHRHEVIEFQTFRRALAYQSRNYFTINCGGFGEHIVIQPNGDITNCPWSTDYLMGRVQEGQSYDDIREYNFYNLHREKLPLYNSDCLRCEAISICGGGCIWADDQTGIKDNSFCYLSKKMIESLAVKYQRKFEL